MTWTAWLTIVGICCIGAMSPGPSLAIVLKHTVAGGRSHGMRAALSHGAGVGLYALLSISGVAVVLQTSEFLFKLLQGGGALYLLWLGVKALRAKASVTHDLPEVSATSAVRDGFMVVFLNPKIAVFFISVFAQVVGTDTTVLAKVLYAATAMVIDGLWYVIVAWLFSNPSWLKQLQQKAVWIDRLFGGLLVALAGKLAWEMV